MPEKYSKWEPIQGIESELWIEALHDDYEGLRIIVKGTNEASAMYSILFPNYYTYRNTDESYRLKLWEEGEFEDRKWSLFFIKASKFIDWVHEESDTLYKKEDMMHYLIKTGADVIEVVTNGIEPKVIKLHEKVQSDLESNSLVRRGKRGSYFDKID